MISSQQALNETIRILKEHLFDVSGETGGSHAYGFYQLAHNIFVKFRVADHGLYMQTFVSHDNGVAPELVSIISVVYRESPKEPIGTKWKTNGYPNSIIAFQYVYPCWDMDFDDIPPIAFELITFAKTSTFVPPHLCTKDVKVQEVTSDIGIRDVTNKLRARYCSIKESKTNKNMKKNVVKLNENTLRQIVAESVNRMLNEMKFGQEVEEYFGVLSNNEIRDIFMEWASNPEFEAAAKAFYGMIRKAADSRLDYTIRKSDGTITDKHGNPLTGGSGDNDAYTRAQEMRGPMGY